MPDTPKKKSKKDVADERLTRWKSNEGGPSVKEVLKQEAQKKRHQLFVIGGIVTLLLTVGIAGVATEGRVFAPVVSFLRIFEPDARQSRNKSVACRDPRNQNTPYCQDYAGSGDSKWSGGGKSWGNSKTAFSLSGR